MDNITAIGGNFKEFAELQSLYDAQFKISQALAKENENLKTEIEHLKNVLAGSATLIDKHVEQPKMQVSTEQAIIEMQIQKMKDDAMNRPLTLEETKRLDLLIKNLHLIKGQSTQIVETKIHGSWSEEQLLSAAIGSDFNSDE